MSRDLPTNLLELLPSASAADVLMAAQSSLGAAASLSSDQTAHIGLYLLQRDPFGLSWIKGVDCFKGGRFLRLTEATKATPDEQIAQFAIGQRGGWQWHAGAIWFMPIASCDQVQALACFPQKPSGGTVDAVSYTARFIGECIRVARGFSDIKRAAQDYKQEAAEKRRKSVPRKGEGAGDTAVVPVWGGGVMDQLADQARALANTELSLLIRGETGTGKDVLAQSIHRQSRRANAPFVVLNCAALTSSLVESELFGHNKGAFTGAIDDHRGLIEQADGGTLFLDEIGDLPLSTQAKFLRVLEAYRVRPIGAQHEIPVNFRLIAASHKDLIDEVARGTFREDLFYRLAQMQLFVPALRDRDRKHILALSTRFMANAKPKQVKGFVRWAARQPWPGNVRQLRSVALAVQALGIDPSPKTLDPLVKTHQGPSVDQTAAETCISPNSSVSKLPHQVQEAHQAHQAQEAHQAHQGPDAAGALGAVDAVSPVAHSPSLATCKDSKGQDMLRLYLPVNTTVSGAEKTAAREVIAWQLGRLDGNRHRVAEALAMPKRTLDYRIKKLGIMRSVTHGPQAGMGNKHSVETMEP